MKPKRGDNVFLKWRLVEEGVPQTCKVVKVFNSLTEDWGRYGEMAWAARDANKRKAEWYAIVRDPKYSEDEYVVASYDVKEVLTKGEYPTRGEATKAGRRAYAKAKRNEKGRCPFSRGTVLSDAWWFGWYQEAEAEYCGAPPCF